MSANLDVSMVSRLEISSECQEHTSCSHLVCITLKNLKSKSMFLQGHKIAVLVNAVAKERIIADVPMNHFNEFNHQDPEILQFITLESTLPTANEVLRDFFNRMTFRPI